MVVTSPVLCPCCSWALDLLPSSRRRLLQQLGVTLPLWCHHIKMRSLLVRRLPRQQQQLHDPIWVPEGVSGACTEPTGPPGWSELWNRIYHWKGIWRGIQSRRRHLWRVNRRAVTQHGEDFHSSQWLDLHQQTGHKCCQTGPQRQTVSAGTPAFTCHCCTAIRPSCKVRAWRPREQGKKLTSCSISTTTGLIMLLRSFLPLLKGPQRTPLCSDCEQGQRMKEIWEKTSKDK